MKGSVGKWLLILLLLLVAAGAYTLWRKVDVQAKRLILPDNPLYAGYGDLPDKTQGVQLTPFTLKGWDGRPVQACIVRRASDELTPRQQTLLDRLHGVSVDDLSGVDYALVCVDWDHGIRSALPLAEALAAAGVTCVLWEPRGQGSVRPYCTHGVQESRDVTAIINALEEQSGRKDLLIVGLGRGFGAELMLHAAAQDARLRAIVSIDAKASLTKSLKRAQISAPMREMIGWRMNQLTGLEPFDIAAVKSAALIPRETPVLLVHLGEGIPESTLEDSIAIYTQLHHEQGKLIALRRAEDAPSATTREVTYAPEGGTREVLLHVEMELANEADDMPVEMLRWLNSQVKPLREAPLPSISLSPDK